MSLKLKICGITLLEDLALLAQCHVNYVGVVLVASSPRAVSIEQATILLANSPLKTVLVVANMDLNELRNILSIVKPDIVQLHGDEDASYAQDIHGVEVWKAVHLKTLLDVNMAISFPASMIVADGRCGGAGMKCDWDLVEKLAKHRQVMLAGGITPENVVDAMRVKNIVGLDVSSGVEVASGIKSASKIKLISERIKI